VSTRVYIMSIKFSHIAVKCGIDYLDSLLCSGDINKIFVFKYLSKNVEFYGHLYRSS
jgi:hypothetical protein